MTSEHAEQSAVFEWAALMSNRYPELQLLFAIPNAGKRSYGAAAWLKNEGLKTGVPDMFFPVQVSKLDKLGMLNVIFPGLFIEMKMPGNTPRFSQRWWIGKLKDQGYRAEVCYSADEAIAVIKDYLGIDNV